MAKEGLFNMISSNIHGASFLDLFCGSGAIGLEALSRGAKEAVFVESAKPAIESTRYNIEKTRLSDSAKLMEMPVTKAIEKLESGKYCFDIIFLDPPYDTDLLTQTLNILTATNLLAPDGIIIAETDSKLSQEIAKNIPDKLKLTETRTYGRTCFLFYQRGEV